MTTRELWPPNQQPITGPKWRDNGSKCRVRGCGQIRQAWAMLPKPVGKDNGPQGEWRCEGGHAGWLWPKHCTYPGTTT